MLNLPNLGPIQICQQPNDATDSDNSDSDPNQSQSQQISIHLKVDEDDFVAESTIQPKPISFKHYHPTYSNSLTDEYDLENLRSPKRLKI